MQKTEAQRTQTYLAFHSLEIAVSICTWEVWFPCLCSKEQWLQRTPGKATVRTSTWLEDHALAHTRTDLLAGQRFYILVSGHWGFLFEFCLVTHFSGSNARNVTVISWFYTFISPFGIRQLLNKVAKEDHAATFQLWFHSVCITVRQTFFL